MKKRTRRIEGDLVRSFSFAALLHQMDVIGQQFFVFYTYGHSQLKTGHPVRSAIHKQLNGRLVLRWVTTWESLLLYVLFLRVNSSIYL
jgi:hypothetical protein